MNSSIRKDELAVALLSSAFVGLGVALTTRALVSWKCLPSVPPDTYRVMSVDFSTVNFYWAGCPILAPLWPTYLGVAVLLGIAAWTCR
ncbi:hypothetical protein [Halorussus caseinilyticus]|uniref:Uncharacterized protein n=1 Tax=Halorussus caseinilyticus TaxID=3034025 RepID=A0ABD5WGG3_9EURY|nr:hypothetical protein [Halorussus sp. DT72]